MRIAVLGHNDVAAHVYRACLDYGGLDIQVRVDKYEDPTDSAWWYQWLPSTLSKEPDKVTVYHLGNKRPYLERQWLRYDPAWMPDFPPEPVQANGYDPKSVWDDLWKDADIDMVIPMSDGDIRDLGIAYDLVFQCFPTQEALKQQSRFYRFPVVKLPRGTDFAPWVPKEWWEKEHNWLILNGRAPGEKMYPWIRMSYLWEELFIEYPTGWEQKIEQMRSDFPKGTKHFYRDEVYPNAKPWHHSPAPNVYLMGKFANYNPKMTRQTEYYRTLEILSGEWRPEPYQAVLPLQHSWQDVMDKPVNTPASGEEDEDLWDKQVEEEMQESMPEVEDGEGL